MPLCFPVWNRLRFAALAFFIVAALVYPVLVSAAPLKVPDVRRDLFLSRLMEARGFADGSDARENAALALKSGVVPEAISDLAAPVTRQEALRWVVCSLGLAEEARILSELELPFEDAKALPELDRGCLTVALRMRPPLLKNTPTRFGPSEKLSLDEAGALLSLLSRASQYLKLEVTFTPAPGMELEIYREGTFSALPKWRVYVNGFDEKSEAEVLQKYLAGQGFKTTMNNPNYEWRLTSGLLDDHGEARRLAALARERGKPVRLLPSVRNVNLENQPFYWALLTIDPSRYALSPITPPEGITTLAPLSTMARASGARAAINAGFFSVSGRNVGFPIGTLRIGRMLVNKPYQGRTCLGWNTEQRAAFGEVAWSGKARLESGWLAIDTLNHFVKGNSVTLYNVFYGRFTPVHAQAAEVVVENGRCVAVTLGGGTPIGPGRYVLSGYGANAALLAGGLKPGDKVSIESVFNEGDALWSGMDNIIQAGPYLIRNGEVRIEPEGFPNSLLNLRHPRSVMGLTGKGQWVFFVGDGRDGTHSAGFTLGEVANILRMKGLTYALNLDGGGSTQLMVGGKIYNSPSEKRERSISYAVGAKDRTQ
ncbi:MAG: phosphodiester glycosidase family protein [Synergistaceae bacterium]|jgi:exopolysaccharide biosynthesis protein|nr:phosphodiester glycosidase family protein [Synergistaceae bacterium]